MFLTVNFRVSHPEKRPVFGFVIGKVVRDNSIDAWMSFLYFPAACLQTPIACKCKRVSLTTAVKANIQRFKAGLDLYFAPNALKTSKKKGASKRGVDKIVEAKIADGDITGAVEVISSDVSFAPSDSSTFETLKSKHPSGEDHEDYSYESDTWPTLPNLNGAANLGLGNVMSFRRVLRAA